MKEDNLTQTVSDIDFVVTNWDEPVDLSVIHYAFTDCDLQIHIDGVNIYDYELNIDGDLTTNDSHHVCLWYLLDNMLKRMWSMVSTNSFLDDEELINDYDFLTTLFCEGHNFPHMKIVENDEDTIKIRYNLDDWSRDNYSTNQPKYLKYHDVGFGVDVEHIVDKDSYIEAVIELYIETARRAKRMCEKYANELEKCRGNDESVEMFSNDYEKWNDFYKVDYEKDSDKIFPTWDQL